MPSHWPNNAGCETCRDLEGGAKLLIRVSGCRVVRQLLSLPLKKQSQQCTRETMREHRQRCRRILRRTPCQTRGLTREGILAAIRLRERRKLPLDSSGMTQGAHRAIRLWKAGRRLFGSWKAALEASGVRSGRGFFGRVFPDAEAVIRELKRRKAEGLSLCSTVVKTEFGHGKSLVRSASREFGCWRGALEAAGFNLQLLPHLKRPYPDKESVIRELKRRNARGLSLVREDLFREGVKGACGFSNSVMREFGGWHKAVRAAGLEPVPHGYTMLKFPRAEDVIRGIKNFDAKGIPLTKTAIIEEPMGCALWNGTLREFGGWRKAVVAAGLQPVQTTEVSRCKDRDSGTQEAQGTGSHHDIERAGEEPQQLRQSIEQRCDSRVRHMEEGP
jgi:hypothetical protein